MTELDAAPSDDRPTESLSRADAEPEAGSASDGGNAIAADDERDALEARVEDAADAMPGSAADAVEPAADAVEPAADAAEPAADEPMLFDTPKAADAPKAGYAGAAIQSQEDAPPCSTCGSIMIRSGSCYKCANCGTTSGCA